MSSAKTSPTLVLNEKIQSLWNEGKDVLHLGFGESRFPTHPLLKNALSKGASNRSYLPSTGTEKLKNIIAKYYSKKLSRTLSANQILVGVGSKSLLYSMIQSLEGNILLPKPSWVSYTSMAALCGKSVIQFNLERDHEYSLDLDTIHLAYHAAKKNGQNPKILILNSPNNPIGNSYSSNDLNMVTDWAKENNLVILSDEIYSLITHNENTHTSPSSTYPEKTIVFGGLSKHLSLGGWRVGIAIVPDNAFGQGLVNNFNLIAGSIWSCVPAPIQIVAETAFSANPEIESYIHTCTKIHQIRTHYVYDHLKALGVSCPKPTGAFYIYISFKNYDRVLAMMGIDSCEDLANHLLETYEIATLPGVAFGDDPDELCLRISTSYLDMETDEKAELILKSFNSGINPTAMMNDHHPKTNLFLNRMDEFLSSLN